MHLGTNQMTVGIGDDVALAPVDLLARIIPCGPPLSVVLTDWLSITPADGLASRPSRSRGMLDQQEIDLLPQTLRLPGVEIALHGRTVGKIARQQTPWTGCPQNL